MAEFALIHDGAIKEIRRYPTKPKDISHKNVVWLPYVEETVDTSTGSETVTVRGDRVIEAKRVVRTTSIRDKTAQEISDEKEQRQEAEFQQALKGDILFRALATALFENINHVRDLQGKQPITQAQYKTYLKGEM